MTCTLPVVSNRAVILLCLFANVLPAFAIGPHEVLLLVNGASTESVAIGSGYARERGIPSLNVVTLDVPLAKEHAPVALSPDAFTRLIWDPATNAVQARGLQHVVVWVFSTAFPTRIETDPGISLQGLVFVRNRMPAPDRVKDGRYESPLFSGPINDRAVGNRPQTLDTLSDWLGRDMPIPSMMLGYTGQRGNTATEVRRCLERGMQSLSTAPTGTVYFVTNEDVRSKCREWQFPNVVRELKQLGVQAVITGTFPAKRPDVVGMMTGAAVVDMGTGNTFLPGAIAEHLTSVAGAFDQAHQTKISAWIEAGACASAGTVVEPMSIWTKFPDARLFVYYASGCTAIESFYQSVRCPLQLLILGDPLACPWGVRDRATIDGPRRLRRGEKATFELRIDSGDSHPFVAFLWLLDGNPREGEARTELETSDIPAGRHMLRGIGRTAGTFRRQAFAEIEVEIQEGGQ